jgi:RHS repeat-associated protein
MKSLCDRENSLFLHKAVKGDTLYKGHHCLVLWDSTNGTQDALGSVLALTDELGDVTDTYEYNEYGALIASTGTSHNPYRFTGQQWDGDSGLYYLRARYYDPVTGRFLSIDLINKILDKYGYVRNNPVNYIDPTGKGIGLFGSAVGLVLAIVIIAGVVWYLCLVDPAPGPEPKPTPTPRPSPRPSPSPSPRPPNMHCICVWDTEPKLVQDEGRCKIQCNYTCICDGGVIIIDYSDKVELWQLCADVLELFI